MCPWWPKPEPEGLPAVPVAWIDVDSIEPLLWEGDQA